MKPETIDAIGKLIVLLTSLVAAITALLNRAQTKKNGEKGDEIIKQNEDILTKQDEHFEAVIKSKGKDQRQAGHAEGVEDERQREEGR